MECSITRNRYSVHFSTVIKSPPINPYISTCRFISSGGKDSGQDYRAHGAVDHTTAGEHQRLDQFCPSDGLRLRKVTRGSVRLRFFLLTSLAFNLFAGTGYFFFSGVTNFGDWAAVIDGLPTHWLWRSLLVVGGIASYYDAVLVVGTGLVRYVGVPW